MANPSISKYNNLYQSSGKSGRLLLPAKTDEAFSKAIAQIREQMLADQGKLSRP